MVRMSGYGQNGPYAGHAGFGASGQAMGGLRYIVGDPATPPSRVGMSFGDSLADTSGCLGALAALRVGDATGRGQLVDSALYERSEEHTSEVQTLMRLWYAVFC